MAKAKRKFDQGNVANLDEARKLAKKKFHPQDLISLTPMNNKQTAFLEAFYSQTPLIVQSGCAGTGKTMMAVYAAFSEVFEESSPYDKVIIVRSAVQTRDQGFMPGTDTEKMDVYEAPYRSITNEVIKSYTGDQYDNLKALGYLEFVSTSFIRGVTFNRAIVIVDEFQSMNYHELATVMTRLGDHSKIVFCGDFKQNDLGTKKNDQSGFHDFMKVVAQMPYETNTQIEYGVEDIVRSGIVREFIKAEHSC